MVVERPMKMTKGQFDEAVVSLAQEFSRISEGQPGGVVCFAAATLVQMSLRLCDDKRMVSAVLATMRDSLEAALAAEAHS
jgi:hypothetical protein